MRQAVAEVLEGEVGLLAYNPIVIGCPGVC